MLINDDLSENFLEFIHFEIIQYDLDPSYINNLSNNFFCYIKNNKLNIPHQYIYLSQMFSTYISNISEYKANDKESIDYDKEHCNETYDETYKDLINSLLKDKFTNDDKQVLSKYFFKQQEYSTLTQVEEILNMDCNKINQCIENINNIIKENFDPTGIEDIISFSECFYRILGITPTISEEMSCINHPLLTFLRNACKCPSYDSLKKYNNGKFTPLTKKFISDHIIDCDICQKRLKIFSNTSSKSSFDFTEINKLKIKFIDRPDKIISLQIWSTRNYFEIINQENYYTTFYPYYVLIAKDSQIKINSEDVIRVQPISTITELKSIGDIYIENIEYIGEPFIIETWNEQPMFASDLDCCIGEIPKEVLTENLIREIPGNSIPGLVSEFRHLEIENTAYLREPVLASFYAEEIVSEEEEILRVYIEKFKDEIYRTEKKSIMNNFIEIKITEGKAMEMLDRSTKKEYGENREELVLIQGGQSVIQDGQAEEGAVLKKSELIGAVPFIEKINGDKLLISIAIFIMENNYTIRVGISKEVNLKTELILNPDSSYSVPIQGHTEDDGDIVFSSIQQGTHSLKIGILEYKLELQGREVSCERSER